MPTYAEIQQRVALDCLNRIDLVPEAKRAIQTTIRKYEKNRFWFNETATSIACSAGQSYIVAPADLLVTQQLEVLQSGSNTKLIDIDFARIKLRNDGSATGRPIWFCAYGENFVLSPIPDSAWSVLVTYTQKLPALSADSDTNGWLSCMEDTVVFGAAAQVSAQIGDVQGAVKYRTLETEHYKIACGHRDQRIITRLKATKF